MAELNVPEGVDPETGEIVDPDARQRLEAARQRLQDAAPGVGTRRKATRRRSPPQTGDGTAEATAAAPPVDGHVEPAPPRRRRAPLRELTAEEIAEEARRQAWKQAQAELRARELAVLEELVPGLATAGEPPIQGERLIPLDARTAAGEVLGLVSRPNGSELHLAVKHYDGQAGQQPKTYLHGSVWFRGKGGVLHRSRGLGLESVEEARAMIAACNAYIDAIESSGASRGQT